MWQQLNEYWTKGKTSSPQAYTCCSSCLESALLSLLYSDSCSMPPLHRSLSYLTCDSSLPSHCIPLPTFISFRAPIQPGTVYLCITCFSHFMRWGLVSLPLTSSWNRVNTGIWRWTSREQGAGMVMLQIWLEERYWTWCLESFSN
jgi:hypothetical protein